MIFNSLKMPFITFLTILSFIYSADVTLSIDGTKLNYVSNSAIAGWEFGHDGCATGSNGGATAANGFIISCSSVKCLAISFTGATIPAGSGNLIDFGSECASITEPIFSNSASQALSVDASDAGLHTVIVENMSFNPSTLNIGINESIQFIRPNTEPGSHNVNGSSADFPNNPESFYSGAPTINAFDYTHTFSIAGTYDFNCETHPSTMTGSITVSGDNDICNDLNACNFGFEEDCVFADGACETCNAQGGVDNDDSDGDGICNDLDECNGSIDACGICGGSATSSGGCYVDLSIGAVTPTTMEIMIDNTVPLAGFEFDITGVTLTGIVESCDSNGQNCVPDGLASALDGTTWNTEGHILGFSFGGAELPQSNGVLMTVEYDGNLDQSCLTNPIFVPGTWAGGSYSIDMGSCYTCDVDCNGECGGSAAVDACGICGGSATSSGGCYVDLSIGIVTPTTMEIMIDNTVPLAGFEFDITGVTLTGIVESCDSNGQNCLPDGLASALDGTTWNAEGHILGFSFGGAELPQSNGVLMTVEYVSAANESCLINPIYVPGAWAGGSYSTGLDCSNLDYSEGNFSIGNVTDSSIEILYSSQKTFQGFQFEIDGANTTIGACGSGGVSESEGVIVTCGSASVLGVSFSGATISPGNGLLTVLSIEPNDGGDVCITNLVVSDENGNALDFEIGDCGTLVDACADIVCEDDGDPCTTEVCSGGVCSSQGSPGDDCGVCFGNTYFGDDPGDPCDCNGGIIDACGICGGSATSAGGCYVDISIGNVTDNTFDILIDNTVPLQGFEFNIDGVTLTGMSTTSCPPPQQLNDCPLGLGGFFEGTTFNSDGKVLGYTLSGQEFPPSSGVFLTFSYVADDPEACLSAPIYVPGTWSGGSYTTGLGDCEDVNCVLDCNGVCGGPDAIDACGICGGNATSEDGCYVDISIGNVTATTIDIMIDNTVPLQGFEFNIDGVLLTGMSTVPCELNPLADCPSGLGGLFEGTTFNPSGKVLGYTLSGQEFPQSSGIFLTFSYIAEYDQACLSGPLYVPGAWAGGSYSTGVGGCAALDCGFGNDADCSGECGGSATTDCNGVCNGADTSLVTCFDGSGACSESECGSCPSGYTGDGFNCSNIDECATDTDNNCHQNASCADTDGSFSCACNSGYLGDGLNCTDIDECASGTDDCDSNYYTCSNNDGGFSCEDIDECATDNGGCDDNATCTNNDGADATCACNGGYQGDGLSCVADCVGNCPTWEDDFDPFAFEFSSFINIGEVLYDGVSIGSVSGDKLAALDANGVLRGVGVIVTPTFGPYSGVNLWELVVKSDNPPTPDVLSFQYYDASADSVYSISNTYTFAPNEQIGTVFSPYIYEITSSVDLEISLAAGYNWISFNLELDDVSLGSVLSTVSDQATFIASQVDGTSTNYGAYGWFGSLTEMSNTQMYLLQMAEPGTLVISGVPADLSTPISVAAGYNWISYLPQSAGALGDALSSVSDQATFIASQVDGTSTNYGSYGWFGSLTEMSPGNGYLLQMAEAGTLIYPSSLSRTDKDVEVADAVILNNKVSDWDFNYADYRYMGAVTLSIEDREDNEGDLVAAFVDGECRGFAERMYFPFADSYMYIVQVYSDVEEGEEISFKYYDSVNNEVVDYVESIAFENYMNVGDGFNTVKLSREIDLSQPMTYSLGEAYPNPFNPVTSFDFTMPEDGIVQVAIYDINGRVVAELVNGHVSAGTHLVTWDANDLSSGVYVINMTAGNYSTMQKIALIK